MVIKDPASEGIALSKWTRNTSRTSATRSPTRTNRQIQVSGMWESVSHFYRDRLIRKSFCHSQREYARDEDQDGFCEVHCNTMEGIWVGLRNFLRPFRGIHKKYLYLYVAMFEWSYNLRWIDFDFLRRLLFPPSTYFPT